MHAAGDQLQKGMVDMMSSFLTLEGFNPSQMMKQTSEMMKQSTDAFRQTTQQGGFGPPPQASGQQPASPAPGATSSAAPQAPGWGPVPPASS